MRRWATLGAITLLMLLLAGCAAPPAQAPTPASAGQLDSEEAILADLANESQEATASPEIADHLEPLNRGIFLFNDARYIHVLDPASRGYKKVVPPDLRQAIKNFFNNLMFPLRMVSSALQGKFVRAGQEISPALS